MANVVNGKASPEPPRTQITTLKGYASRVFKESGVGMVSSIAQTSSTRRRCFKAFVLIFCLTGFFYQSAKFLTVVFTYPTVVDIDIVRPETFNVPAFTFCDNNEIKRSLYCKKYPERCIEPDGNFCEKYYPYCENNGKLVPKKQFYDLRNMPPEEILELNSNLERFLIDYEQIKLHSEISGPYLRHKDDSDNPTSLLCYTWNDHVDSSQYPANGRRNGFFKEASNKFTFNVEDFETFIPGTLPGMLFSVHSPFDAMNPFRKGIFMKPGRTYVIYVSMEEELLLKKPYDTDCTNYSELWETRGRKGPRTQEMCKHKCGIEVSTLCFNCSPSFFMYPNNSKICMNSELYVKDCPDIEEHFKNCTKNCKDDCQRTKYNYQVQERFSVKFDEKGGVINNSAHLVFVEVYLEEDEIIVLKYSPKYMIVEVFSTIGGFIGGWLGISLLDVTDIFEGFFRIFRYSLKRI